MKKNITIIILSIFALTGCYKKMGKPYYHSYTDDNMQQVYMYDDYGFKVTLPFEWTPMPVENRKKLAYDADVFQRANNSALITYPYITVAIFPNKRDAINYKRTKGKFDEFSKKFKAAMMASSAKNISPFENDGLMSGAYFEIHNGVTGKNEAVTKRMFVFNERLVEVSLFQDLEDLARKDGILFRNIITPIK